MLKLNEHTEVKDLGVDATGGRRRMTIMRKRFAKFGRRAVKVGILARSMPSASKLFNMHDWTAGLYGAAAFGISGRWMKTLRWKVSQATGMPGRQRCPTCCRSLAKMDGPAEKVPLMVVRQWVALWRNATEDEQLEIRRA